LNYFKQLQYDHLSGFKKSLLGAAASLGYNPETYGWFKELGLAAKDSKILDVGCGKGNLLKQLFQVGFINLTGIDPYIADDIIYNEHLKILKKSIFEVDEKFDLIMSHHSLEHMSNHFEVLSRIHQQLNKNGKLLIRIPIMSKTLFDKYGVNMVSLDAPRHFFIHSIKSIKMLLHKIGFDVKKVIYDAKVFDVIGSEQYLRDISLHDSRSYTINKKNTVFSKKEISGFKKSINDLNKQEKSSSVALYIEKA
jgi:2-polyprenyl-3-methyl-5-hydroxy-6-metoxy-1,4-benzoquinol methylase